MKVAFLLKKCGFLFAVRHVGSAYVILFQSKSEGGFRVYQNNGGVIVEGIFRKISLLGVFFLFLFANSSALIIGTTVILYKGKIIILYGDYHGEGSKELIRKQKEKIKEVLLRLLKNKRYKIMFEAPVNNYEYKNRFVVKYAP